MKNIYRELLSLTEEDIAELMAADESEFEDEDENGYSAEELEWIDYVKSKLSAKQRAFVDYFKEVIDKDKNLEHGLDRYLVFLGVLDLFERKPEFCPDASLDFLKHTVRHKKFEDDYAEIVEIMTIWSDNVRASKKLKTRWAVRMSALPSLLLYPAFIVVLSFTFIQGMHIYEHFVYGVNISWIKQIAFVLLGIYGSKVFGKAVLFKNLPKNLNI